MVYRVVGCPVCGEIQVSQADPNGRMKCVYCGKSRNLRGRAMWKVKVYGTFEFGWDAVVVCGGLRKEKGMKERAIL